MNTKAYMAPAIKIVNIRPVLLGGPSVTYVGGDAGIGKGTGTAPGTADSRRGSWGWDDEEEW